MTRFYADLNPCYPARGEHRWRVYLAEGPYVRAVGKSYRSRRSAEAAACRAYVELAFCNLGIRVGEVRQ